MPVRFHYLAYGSNLDPARLARHLGTETEDVLRCGTAWMTIGHRVRFAGLSQRWNGGVALLSLSDVGARTPVRLYPFDGPTFARLFASENLIGSLPDDPGLLGLAPRQWVRMLIPGGSDDWRGKYNAVLRSDDVDGAAVYTLSTCRQLGPRPPSPEYRQLIETARRGAPGTILDGADESFAGEGGPADQPDLSTRQADCWFGRVTVGAGAGVVLPAVVDPGGPYPQALVINPASGVSEPCDVRYDGNRATVGTELAGRLGIAEAEEMLVRLPVR